ncbi:MAG TPA: ABC transporter permease [Elusimicrobiota bacterium]|nr:ABC transporter permease [Elusimicrobiota bacterium]
MSLIELEKITKAYFSGGDELQVLKNITLRIDEGEFVAIMGPSGSGKSTLMQILGLLDRPTSGTYRLLGQDVSRLSDDQGAAFRSKTIGFIFQMFNLLPRTSALDNVILPMIYSGATDRESRARDLLGDVGLSDRMEHKPNQLSGGQQQRVAIARALVNRPRLLFADEPTGNLASDQAEGILSQLVDLNRSGITVVMVTHEPDIAAYARRIIRLKDGVVVSDETRDSSSARNENTKAQRDDFRPVMRTARSVTVTLPFPVRLKNRLTAGFEYGTSALRALASNKVRSALSMLGILIGVSSVIAMLAVGTGAQKAIETRLASLGSNLLMLSPGRHTVGGVHGEGGSVNRLTLDDMKAISQVNSHILRVDANVSGSVQVVYSDKNTNTELTGATPAYAPMRASQPYYGRFFTEKENELQSRVILLGQTVVKNLFGTENPVGKVVKVNRVNYRVIGILPLKGSGGFRDQDDAVIVPLRTAMKRILGKEYVNRISIECDGPAGMDEVTQDITRLMRKRHRLPEYKDDDFEIRNMAEMQAALTSTTKTFTLLLGIVAAISLLVGGIGIMNIMLVSVSERTREIGLRKAVGATRRAILSQFLLESSVLSTLGGISGILLGAVVSLIISKLAGWSTVVSPSSVLLAFVFSSSVGIVFGFWPARKASLLSPIEALRYE